ncbi:hypothetical protein VMCG_09760 [Cytospora schulzeri]|uniref:Uncharacterized protein n=1 Tax=Cytospora schulzeri TaxID=448051 RepID=A0A423VGG4_9PEZI|nr:hypothetical protein VMCG_09760 [Valsa malicola]
MELSIPPPALAIATWSSNRNAQELHRASSERSLVWFHVFHRLAVASRSSAMGRLSQRQHELDELVQL